jgi:hypothetical protein
MLKLSKGKALFRLIRVKKRTTKREVKRRGGTGDEGRSSRREAGRGKESKRVENIILI